MYSLMKVWGQSKPEKFFIKSIKFDCMRCHYCDMKTEEYTTLTTPKT